MLVQRRYAFSASHRLHSAALSEAQNRELFGKCNNPYGHGHNYEVEVSVQGPVDARTGRAVDLQKLDDLVHRNVTARYGHRYLNDELPEFAATVATTENLGAAIGARLQSEWATAFSGDWPKLERIRIWETARNTIEVKL